MKYSTAMLTLATAASAQSAQPAFTNEEFNVVEGQPFTLTFDGCDAGCTIILSNGASNDLQDVQELTSDATGGEFTFTPESLPSDTYAFEIVNNETGETNYSVQFEYEGEDAPASSTVVETFTSVSTATIPVTETTSTSSAGAGDTTTVTSFTVLTTPPASETTSATATDDEDDEEATSSAPEETTTPTTIPEEGAAATFGSPLTLVAAAVAGLFMFN